MKPDKNAAEINHNAQFSDALDMTTHQLEKRCAKAAAKAGKFLASARAIIEPELAYFMELRHRLSAPGQRGVEGWQKWVEKHFSCSVRTINRNLSLILGPEKERKKPESSRGRKAVVEAFVYASEPAIRLAKKYPHDPDAEDFLNQLQEGDLAGLVPEPQPRPANPIDEMRRLKQVRTQELYSMGIQLAHAVMEGVAAVNVDMPEGKRIVGLAKKMLSIEKKAEPQDKLSQGLITPDVFDFAKPRGSVEGNSVGTTNASLVRSQAPAQKLHEALAARFPKA